MPKGKATATVSGRKIAEAEEWEVVEGNVYVRLSSSTKNIKCLLMKHSSHLRMCEAPLQE